MYEINFKLPEGWTSRSETFEDESGNELSHLEAGTEGYELDVYAGVLPEDETAEDQAFSNYADMVGFDEDDPEDFNPVSKIKFNGKNAWTFDALCEDDRPMRLISQEVRQGVLVITCFNAPDEDSLDEMHALIERSLRIR